MNSLNIYSVISILDRVSCSTLGTFRRIGSATSSTVFINNQKSRTPLQKRKAAAVYYGQVDAISAAESIELLGKESNFDASSFAGLQPLLLNLNSFFRQVILFFFLILKSHFVSIAIQYQSAVFFFKNIARKLIG